MRITKLHIILFVLSCFNPYISAQNDTVKYQNTDSLMTLESYENKVLDYSQLLKQKKEQAVA